MRLTISGHSFEILPLEGVLAVCKAMGFKGVDISGFHARGRIGFEPDDILKDTQGQADRLNRALEKYELECVDFFPQFGASPDQHSLNDPNPEVQKKTLEKIRACAHFCQLTFTPGMTILPGVDHPSRSLEENLKVAGENMKKASDICGEYGIELRYEPHMSSVAYSPELAIRLIEEYAPAARVTLDYSHFILQYMPEERIHTLIPYAGHFHVRPARPGKLQVRHVENTIHWDDIIRRLKAIGYKNCLSVEYVCSDWYDLNQVDTLYETTLTKEYLEPLVGSY